MVARVKAEDVLRFPPHIREQIRLQLEEQGSQLPEPKGKRGHTLGRGDGVPANSPHNALRLPMAIFLPICLVLLMMAFGLGHFGHSGSISSYRTSMIR